MKISINKKLLTGIVLMVIIIGSLSSYIYFLSRDKMKPNDELNKEGTNSISNNENATNNPTQEDTTLEQNDIISGNENSSHGENDSTNINSMRIQITTV